MTENERKQIRWAMFDKDQDPLRVGVKLGFNDPREFYSIIYNGRKPTAEQREKILNYFKIEVK